MLFGPTFGSSTWVQQQKLVGSGASGQALQGTSVGLSSSAKTAVVGGPGDGTYGAAWVFVAHSPAAIWSLGLVCGGRGAFGCQAPQPPVLFGGSTGGKVLP